MDWNEVAPLLTGYAHIATADAGGRPLAAMVSAVVEGPSVWVLTTKSSAKARNLSQNPQISMMWSPGAEVYLQGNAELIDDLHEKRRLWNSGLLAYDPAMFFGTPENPDLVLVKVAPASALVMTMGADGPSQRRWKA